MEPLHVERSNIGADSFSPPERGSSRINVGKEERIFSVVTGLLFSYWGLKKASLFGLLGAAAGAALISRGATGYCPASEAMGIDTSGKRNPVADMKSTIAVNRPREELYAYWRNLANLPNFMTHLKEVNELDNKRSHWSAKIPGNVGTVDWESEIVAEEKNHLLSWRSLPDSQVDNAGEVRFEDAPDGMGTLVHTTISYRPPAGEVGAMVAKLFNAKFEEMVREDLFRFKNFMETGGLPKAKSIPDPSV